MRLLDANVLIALAVSDHVHHERARQWFAATEGRVATTPIVQGALLRFLMRGGARVGGGLEVLASVTDHERHELWPDDLGYADVDLSGVIGHRQLTDAYLAGLARHRVGRLATFDGGLAALHADVVDLIPTEPS